MKSSLMITACLLLLLLLMPSPARANGKDNALAGSRGDEIRKGAVSGSQGRHLNADDSLRDLLAHPAFAGFAKLLLPWDGRRYDDAMRLSDIGSLLPYHSHVNPETVVGALNRMIDDVNTGHAVLTFFATRRLSASASGTTSYGEVRSARGWRLPSVRTELPPTAATCYPNRQPS